MGLDIQISNTGTPFTITRTGSGANFSLGAGPGTSFTLSPSDFTQVGRGSYITSNGTNGFTTTNSNTGPGESFWGPEFGSVQGAPSPAKRNELLAYWSNNGLSVNSNTYMFNVTWGPGSTQSSGVVLMGLYDYSNGMYTYLDFGVVDTSKPGWQTPGSWSYNGPIKTLAGTWNLPATFTVITPLIADPNDWC